MKHVEKTFLSNGKLENAFNDTEKQYYIFINYIYLFKII